MKNLKRHVFKDKQMANKNKKRCPESLITGEMQTKPQWDAASYLLGCLLATKTETSGGKDVETLEPCALLRMWNGAPAMDGTVVS